jgi:hypothetical protein
MRLILLGLWDKVGQRVPPLAMKVEAAIEEELT